MVLLRLGHFDDDAATLLVAGIVAEVATQVGQVALAEGQSEAETLGKVVDLGEGHEHHFLGALGQTWTHVLDDEAHSLLGLGDAQHDVLTVGVFY